MSPTGDGGVNRNDEPVEVVPKKPSTEAVDNLKLVVAGNVLRKRVADLCVRIKAHVEENNESIDPLERLIDELTT